MDATPSKNGLHSSPLATTSKYPTLNRNGSNPSPLENAKSQHAVPFAAGYPGSGANHLQVQQWLKQWFGVFNNSPALNNQIRVICWDGADLKELTQNAMQAQLIFWGLDTNIAELLAEDIYRLKKEAEANKGPKVTKEDLDKAKEAGDVSWARVKAAIASELDTQIQTALQNIPPPSPEATWVNVAELTVTGVLALGFIFLLFHFGKEIFCLSTSCLANREKELRIAKYGTGF